MLLHYYPGVTYEFHPELRRAAKFLPSRGPKMTPRVLWLMRKGMALAASRSPRDVEVVTLGPGFGVRVHRPAGIHTPSPAVLWAHGGGYVGGNAAVDDKMCKRFAQNLGAVLVAVEYRLAPENPYPAALDDCEAAMKWLLAQPDVDSSRIAIAGASAGGGLTAALALRLRDQGAVQPVMQLLVYPMVDDRPSLTPDPEPKRRRFLDKVGIRASWDAYLGDADPAQAVPARATDLSGLPPTWIGVGSNDFLLNECVEYADRLKQACVPCELEIVPGAFHLFDLVAAKAEVTQKFFASQCAALRGALTAR
jgi:acetyl esterase/lipase